MKCWLRQKNHLVQLSLKDKPIITEDSPFEGDSEESSNDEVMWADSELDDEPENTLKKLFSGTKNIKPSKQPLRYTGNSIRTQKRHKATAKKIAIQNGNTIMQFFFLA